MFHGFCLHRNHNLHHTITQDEDTDENRHLWLDVFWLFVRSLPQPPLGQVPFFSFSFSADLFKSSTAACHIIAAVTLRGVFESDYSCKHPDKI